MGDVVLYRFYKSLFLKSGNATMPQRTNEEIQNCKTENPQKETRGKYKKEIFSDEREIQSKIEQLKFKEY